MSFQLILFGKNIVYFNQYLQAISMLGVSGLGKHQAHFIIVSVKNQYWQDILVNNSIQMGNYQISMLGEYIDYRMRQLKKVQLQESQLPKEQQKSFSHVSDACTCWTALKASKQKYFGMKRQRQLLLRANSQD